MTDDVDGARESAQSMASAPIRDAGRRHRRGDRRTTTSRPPARVRTARDAVSPATGGSRSSARSEPPARVPTDRSRGTSGVDRRTESGARGGDGLVMSGVSSSMRRSEQRQLGRRRARRERRAAGARRRDAIRPALRPNSASNPDVARRAVPASINARSSRPSTASVSCRMGKSGSAKVGASANSYPQLRQRSAVSNPT